MKLHLISFAGSTNSDNPIYKALERIKKQAEKLAWFDHIKVYTDQDLKQDSIFWDKHKNFLLANKKGYGFWLWKPYIINKYLDSMNISDILVYVDAGCEIQKTNINKNTFIDDITSQNFMAFKQNLDLHIRQYTKSICYNFFEVYEKDLLNNKIYLEAGRLALIKNDQIIKIINDWYNIMDNHYELYDLSIPIPNSKTFLESRHDQMILNFILYKHNFLNTNSIFSKHYKSLFLANRNKTGISMSCRNSPECICNCCVN